MGTREAAAGGDGAAAGRWTLGRQKLQNSNATCPPPFFPQRTPNQPIYEESALFYFSMHVQSNNLRGASFVLTLMNDQSINFRREGIIFHSLLAITSPRESRMAWVPQNCVARRFWLATL